MEMSVLAIVQARMGSTRLPGKVLKAINGVTLIEILLQRLSQSKLIDKIVLATGENKENDILQEKVRKLEFEVFRGSEDNVLDRYYQAAKLYRAKTIVRITGDCPFIDSFIVDKVIGLFLDKELDYVSNTDPPTFPDGLDVEVFSFKELEKAQEQAETMYEREHVTPLIRQNKKIKQMNYIGAANHSAERWTVDNPEDLAVVCNVLNYFSPDLNFSWEKVLRLKQSHPEYFEANKNIQRNEGSMIDSRG
tara:strand:- start:613 stop:1359 length:747 start_codon:yes stop_codon:yes gene_type:complete